MGIPEDILDDVCCRFLVNLPDDQRSDPIRVCFQAELAHWFYVDFYCQDVIKYPKCNNIGVREFIRIIFNHCEFLKHFSKSVDQIVDEWRAYKSAVPSYGAILLDKALDNVLLVKGYYSRNSWGFPKGKVNEGEEPLKCAIREVFEETSFDISSKIELKNQLHKLVGDTSVQLFIIPDVPADFPFKPRTRYEIGKIQWFRICDLPSRKTDSICAEMSDSQSSRNFNFFNVSPFVDSIKLWVKKQKQNLQNNNNNNICSPEPAYKNKVAASQCASAFDIVTPQCHFSSSPLQSLFAVDQLLCTSTQAERNESCSNEQDVVIGEAVWQKEAENGNLLREERKTLGDAIELAKAWRHPHIDYTFSCS